MKRWLKTAALGAAMVGLAAPALAQSQARDAALQWSVNLTQAATTLANAAEGAIAFADSLDVVAADEVQPKAVYLSAHENDRIAYSGSTWFEIGDVNPKRGERGFCGAAHSVEGWGASRFEHPLWTRAYDDDEFIMRPEGLDIACFGVWFNSEPVRPTLQPGQPVIIRGYPGGSTVNGQYEVRIGYVLFERPEEFRGGDAPSYIVRLTNGSTLVIGGMSGGLVTALPFEFSWPDDATSFDTADLRGKRGLTESDTQRMIGDNAETPVGVLITQNSRADLDGDGFEEHSADIVFGVDAYEAVLRCPDCWTYSRWLERQH